MNLGQHQGAGDDLGAFQRLVLRQRPCLDAFLAGLLEPALDTVLHELESRTDPAIVLPVLGHLDQILRPGREGPRVGPVDVIQEPLRVLDALRAREDLDLLRRQILQRDDLEGGLVGLRPFGGLAALGVLTACRDLVGHRE
ncbi:hypothetical protein D3C87_1270180 [compost metagenome]